MSNTRCENCSRKIQIDAFAPGLWVHVEDGGVYCYASPFSNNNLNKEYVPKIATPIGTTPKPASWPTQRSV